MRMLLRSTRHMAAAVAALALGGLATQALALSDARPASPLPMEAEVDAAPAPAPEGTPAGDAARPETRLDQPLPEVIYDLDRLPEPVRRMHGLILEAARSGDLERLRPLLGTGQQATQITLGALQGDPIDFLREISGDAEGHEILAILLEVMEAGFVRLDPDTSRERYVWPYFFALPLEALTPSQRVELFTLITAGDYEDMRDFGAYIFYRAAITPEGHWLFFLAGD